MAAMDTRGRGAGSAQGHSEDRDAPPVEQLVADIRRGGGLGGRTLGEAGTTGGTQVGIELQRYMDRDPAAGRPYTPGIAGRTARGGLGRAIRRYRYRRQRQDGPSGGDTASAGSDAGAESAP